MTFDEDIRHLTLPIVSSSLCSFSKLRLWQCF